VDLTHIDGALWTLGVVGQIFLFFILINRRLYRTSPIFTTYILYASISDIVVATLFLHASPRTYFVVYFVNTVPEYLLQLGILVEVAYNVVSPVKRSLPKRSLYLLGALLAGGAIFTLLFSMNSKPDSFPSWSERFVQLNFTFAILRLVIFSAIACFSQMLGIGWKNHVLQIATGFASYSIITLLIELLHRSAGTTDVYRYHLYEQFRIVGWCMALGYWSYVLARKEAVRKEFSPGMASFLISMSEALGQSRENAVRLYRK
jgi:hypothetical protein